MMAESMLSVLLPAVAGLGAGMTGWLINRRRSMMRAMVQPGELLAFMKRHSSFKVGGNKTKLNWAYVGDDSSGYFEFYGTVGKLRDVLSVQGEDNYLYRLAQNSCNFDHSERKKRRVVRLVRKMLYEGVSPEDFKRILAKRILAGEA